MIYLPGADYNVWLVMSIVVAIFLLAWLLIYLTRQVLIGTQTLVLLTDNVISINSPNYTTLLASNMPQNVNGNTYSYMFWMKLVSFNTTNVHKLLWYRSKNVNSMLGTPVVLLDAQSNRLYILMATNLTPAGIDQRQVIGGRIEDWRTVYRFAVASIDYVPMSRWTHIAIIVNDRYVQVALDGNLYSSGTVDRYANDGDKNSSVRPTILPADGAIYIGGQRDVQGQITRMQFANFPVSIRDVKKTYEALPSGSSGLSLLGLPKYGLRNPIYKLE